MKNSKSLIQKITDMKVILALQVVASLILVFFIYRLNMLPMLYLGIVVVILSILCGIMFALMRVKKQRSKRSIIGKVVSILISILLLVASLSVIKGDSVLSKITGSKTQTQTISVIVLKDSKAEKISDLKGKSFGINTKTDKNNTDKAVADIKSEISDMETSDYEDYSSLATALYDSDVDAIIANEAYRGIFEENHENFGEETRIVYSFEIEEEIEDVTTAVDVTTAPFNLYISGIDTYGPVSTVSRTDVNLLVTVNPKTRQILMTSIPRDTYVTLASFNAKDKLTHSGIYGVNETIKTVENWLGIDINYYARVNFTSLTEIVDALGGITVNSPVAFNTSSGTSISAGNNYLNGKETLAFARERKHLSGGDFDRGKNQMRALTGIINKMMSPSVITNYSSVLDSVSGSFQTNMESGDISALIKMQLNDMSGWTITQQQITGKGQTGGLSSYAMPGYKLYMMVPDSSSVKKAQDNIEKVKSGQTPVVQE